MEEEFMRRRKVLGAVSAAVLMLSVALISCDQAAGAASASDTSSTSSSDSTSSSSSSTTVKYYDITNYSVTSETGSVVADGVTQTSYNLSEESTSFSSGYKLNKLYVLDVDPSQNSALGIAVGCPSGYVRGLDTTSDMAAYVEANTTYTVLGGVNGDFFDTISGGPLGFTMKNGRWLTTGEYVTDGTWSLYSSRSKTSTTYNCHPGYSFGIKSDGTAIIGIPTVAMTFDSWTGSTQDNDDVEINILNQLRSDATTSASQPDSAYSARGDNEIVLYTPDYYSSTETASGGYEVTFSTDDTVTSNGTISGTVTAVSADGNATLSSGYMVLSGYGDGATALETLAVGDTIEITVTVDSAWSDVVDCIGGGRPDGDPLLVSGGAICAEDSGVAEYSSFYGNNPRTAVGVRSDGSYFFIVVDGRQSGVSEGATINELSQFALDLGADMAINLDGGKSSTMITATGTSGSYNLINTPANSGAERSDGNAVYVVSK